MVEQNVTCIISQCLLLAVSCTVYALCGLPTVLWAVRRTETDGTLTVWQRETGTILYILQCLCYALQQMQTC
jgi:hypothetical protein